MKKTIATVPQAPRLSLCQCGHTGNTADSNHGPRFAPGHGPCGVKGCTCKQFTWASYVDVAPGQARKGR